MPNLSFFTGCLYNEFQCLPKTVDEPSRKAAMALLEKESEQAMLIQELRERLQNAEQRMKGIRKECQDFRDVLEKEDVEKAQSDFEAYCG